MGTHKLGVALELNVHEAAAYARADRCLGRSAISTGLLCGSAQTLNHFVHSPTSHLEPSVGSGSADSEDLGCFRNAVSLDIAEQKHLPATPS
jgi:hypothetical protein